MEQTTWTRDDAKTLAEKLVEFMESLTPPEMALFEHKIQMTMPQKTDVGGYNYMFQKDQDARMTAQRFETWVWEQDEL